MSNDEPPKKVSAKDFKLLEWATTIPLLDDLWLRMQAQNIAIIDMAVLRPMEESAMEEFYKHDRISPDTLQTLSSLSQMWIFSLYEFLRTWLDRASGLIGYSERIARQKTDEDRAREMDAINIGLEERAKYVKIGKPIYLEQVKRIGDKEFMRTISQYRDSITSTLFRDVEAIRMPLAKHEIANGKGYFAEAPGYGRVSLEGSMYWQIANLDGSVETIERRKLADKFLHIKTLQDEAAEAEVAEKKTGLSEADMKWLDQMFGPEGEGTKQVAVEKRRRRRRRHLKREADGTESTEKADGRRRRRGRRGGRQNRRGKAEPKAAPEGGSVQ